MPNAAVPTAAEIIAKVGDSLSPDRSRLIEEAYAFAMQSHEGQERDSGDPYIVHPIDAAVTVAGLNLDASAIAAALLHDVVEDCGVSNAEIGARFGDDVARLVDGVTKLSRLNLLRPEEPTWDQEVQADNLRKMFLAMAEDIRVVIIKLADRLHNMRTLDALSREKQIRDFNGFVNLWNAAKLVWRLKVRGVETGRILLFGVKKKFRTRELYGLPFLLLHQLYEASQKRRYKWCEESWVLETNTRLNAIMPYWDAYVYKRYRIYEKAL